MNGTFSTSGSKLDQYQNKLDVMLAQTSLVTLEFSFYTANQTSSAAIPFILILTGGIAAIFAVIAAMMGVVWSTLAALSVMLLIVGSIVGGILPTRNILPRVYHNWQTWSKENTQ